MIDLAEKFAVRWHDGQTRDDGTTPYVTHCESVAKLVTAVGGDKAAVAAAWLHDVLEDTDCPPQELALAFGPTVFETVLAVTYKGFAHKAERRAAQLSSAKHMPWRAKLVKLADLTTNMADLIYRPPTWGQVDIEKYAAHLMRMRDALRGTNDQIEQLFDALIERDATFQIIPELLDEA